MAVRPQCVVGVRARLVRPRAARCEVVEPASCRLRRQSDRAEPPHPQAIKHIDLSPRTLPAPSSAARLPPLRLAAARGCPDARAALATALPVR